MGKRTWIKLYCDNWVTGSLRNETAEVRGVWADLLALVGSSPNSDTGELKLMNGIGWTDEQITKILRISIELWKHAKQRFIETNQIIVSSDNEIGILNWNKYQEDYTRQTRYKKRKSPTTPKK